jgi:uncharacterized protein with gpF-like domain
MGRSRWTSALRRSSPSAGGCFIPLIDRNRTAVESAYETIRSDASAFLEALGQHVASVARGLATKLAKGKGDEPSTEDAIASSVESYDWTPLGTAVQPELEQLAKDGAKAALEQVGADVDELLHLANERAVAWAKAHAGELIAQLKTTTVDQVRDLVAAALEAGASNDVLADDLADLGVFGDDRADRIARTETAIADVRGNLAGWAASGVVASKRWIVGTGCCEACEELDGVEVPLDEEFPDEGGDGPPAHPNCRCDVLPVLAVDDEDEAA